MHETKKKKHLRKKSKMLRINNFNPIPFPAGVLKNQDKLGRGEYT